MTLFKNKYRVESARLKNWDYGWNGKYFVTIVTKFRKHYFGEIINGEMDLLEIGKYAKKCWCEIPEHFPFVILDEFQIMPNHIHGIIVLNKNGDCKQINRNRNRRDVACNVSTITTMDNAIKPQSKTMSDISPKSGSLSTIIRSFKSAVTKFANKNNFDFGWQPRFYEHIIRDEKSLNRICDYIRNNPKKWTNGGINL